MLAINNAKAVNVTHLGIDHLGFGVEWKSLSISLQFLKIKSSTISLVSESSSCNQQENFKKWLENRLLQALMLKKKTIKTIYKNQLQMLEEIRRCRELIMYSSEEMRDSSEKFLQEVKDGVDDFPSLSFCWT